MIQNQDFSSQLKITGALATSVLYGAGIALLFIGIFLFGTETESGWSQYWMLRPLIVVPLAGALGGAFSHFMAVPKSKGGLVKILTLLFSFIGYVVIVWMGTVLGLDGTLWD